MHRQTPTKRTPEYWHKTCLEKSIVPAAKAALGQPLAGEPFSIG